MRAATALIGIVVLAWVGPAMADGGGGPGPRLAGEHVVRPGETVWSIAQASYDEDVDPRVAVEAIEDLNAISAGDLRAGQHLLLPAL
jgi:LysM repeat protein